ncbi:MAG: hypothetical protein ACRDRN_14460 [Sciscionella sp.]
MPGGYSTVNWLRHVRCRLLIGAHLDHLGVTRWVGHQSAFLAAGWADARRRRVWAIGDITGKGAFTHISMYQAAIATRDILGTAGEPAEYHAVPRVMFTDSEIGAVGLTEAQARHRGLRVRVGYAAAPSSARGWIHKACNDGFVKLIEDAERGNAAAPVPRPAQEDQVWLARRTLTYRAQHRAGNSF